MNKNTTRHSERCYARNSFGLLARRLGFRQNNSVCCNWILRCTQNDGYARKLSFTMAEILLSLTIIGVVAAITLPSLTGNINEKIWNTQKKALYARLSQAIKLMPSLNGYGKYEGSWSANSVNVTQDTTALTFVTSGLSKVMKINNICDSDHLQDCGISSMLTTFMGSKIVFPKKLSELNNTFVTTYIANTGQKYINPQKNVDTKVAAFETINGESIAVFYNPYCISDVVNNGYIWNDIENSNTNKYTQPKMCANFIYDLNGLKGPNTVGKDIGWISAIYPTDTEVVAPILSNVASDTTYWTRDRKNCNAKGKRLPNLQEAISIYYNIYLYGYSNLKRNQLWSGTLYNTNAAYFISVKVWNGRIEIGSINESHDITTLCVDR